MLCFEPLKPMLEIYSQANTSKAERKKKKAINIKLLCAKAVTGEKKSLNTKGPQTEERQSIATSGNILQPFKKKKIHEDNRYTTRCLRCNINQKQTKLYVF